jgi:hypothetical protein
LRYWLSSPPMSAHTRDEPLSLCSELLCFTLLSQPYHRRGSAKRSLHRRREDSVAPLFYSPNLVEGAFSEVRKGLIHREFTATCLDARIKRLRATQRSEHTEGYDLFATTLLPACQRATMWTCSAIRASSSCAVPARRSWPASPPSPIRRR